MRWSNEQPGARRAKIILIVRQKKEERGKREGEARRPPSPYYSLRKYIKKSSRSVQQQS
jgi:hypothetical protein